MTDNLITCPKCKVQESCYSIPFNEFHNSYVCFNCGFQTSDLMREAEFDFEEYLSGHILDSVYKLQVG